jgi:sugar-specific transcriptional regulator TrmB
MKVNGAEPGSVVSILESMGLGYYHALALGHILVVGEAKATDLAKMSGVPSARIYEVLKGLGDMGLVRARPGRPIVYTTLSPREICRALVSVKRQEAKKEIETLVLRSEDLLRAVERPSHGTKKPEHSPLVRVIPVGKVSEDETKFLYKHARKQIMIFTRAFEYLPRVIEEIASASLRRASIRVQLLDSSKLKMSDREVQDRMLALLNAKTPSVGVRFAQDIPLRGTIVDPESKAKAIFHAEELDVPLFVREACVTENKGLVRALASFFELSWEKANSPPSE